MDRNRMHARGRENFFHSTRHPSKSREREDGIRLIKRKPHKDEPERVRKHSNFMILSNGFAFMRVSFSRSFKRMHIIRRIGFSTSFPFPKHIRQLVRCVPSVDTHAASAAILKNVNYFAVEMSNAVCIRSTFAHSQK